jgi:hypothetical protein
MNGAATAVPFRRKLAAAFRFPAGVISSGERSRIGATS